MANRQQTSALGDLVTQDAKLTLADLCKNCELSERHIISYVAEGIVEPQGNNEQEWRFSRTHLIEIRRATRLERDLRLNAAGVALTLELMARIKQLESQLAQFKNNPQD